MGETYNLCIIKPNKSAFSETFIQEHIDRLAGNKKILYGGAFPVYDDQNHFLIKSKFGLLKYLVQKRLFNKKDINVRTNALKQYLLNNKIDLVFAEYGIVGALVTDACKKVGVPLVVHFHGADAYHKGTLAEYGGFYKKMFAYAAAIISVSNDMVRRLEALGAPTEKIINASCGIDVEAFPKINISASGKDFLFVGRFVEKKSPLSLVKAFKIVVDQMPDAKLWMVGDGPMFNETKELITDLVLNKNINLTGVLTSERIKELMKRMRAFVQHSVRAVNGDSEGTPVTVLEASSSGLPVVATRHAGIKEAVVDGVTGFLVAEHDIAAMAAKMIILAESPLLAAKMGAAAREHMISKYQIQDRIRLLDTIIQNNINSNHSN